MYIKKKKTKNVSLFEAYSNTCKMEDRMRREHNPIEHALQFLKSKLNGKKKTKGLENHQEGGNSLMCMAFSQSVNHN